MLNFVMTEPQHEISNNVVCATSKGSDQPAHTSSLIRAVASRLNILLTEHHLEFLSLKGGCTVSSESFHIKMSYCWKSCHGSYVIYHGNMNELYLVTKDSPVGEEVIFYTLICKSFPVTGWIGCH